MKVWIRYIGPLVHASLGEQGDDRYVAAYEQIELPRRRARALVENGGNNWEYCEAPVAPAVESGGEA